MRTASSVRTVLIRSWNLFHGNTLPPQRQAFLREMVELAIADEPDVLCLQEVPLWALELLDDWSGMVAVGDRAGRAMLGPLPSSPRLGKAITGLNHGLFRSAFSGQANAILLRSDVRLLDHRVETLNPLRFRTAQARRLGLDRIARLSWAKERRICQAVHLSPARRQDGVGRQPARDELSARPAPARRRAPPRGDLRRCDRRAGRARRPRR